MSLKSSFFTDTFDPNLLNWRSNCCPNDSNNLFTVQVCLSLNDKEWKTKQVMLKNQYLFTTSKKNGQKWICYENSILRTQVDHRDQKTTLILTQGNSTLIMKGEVDLLLKTMKRFTVQEDFKQKFQLVRKLGQGSFAKVYSARDKLNEAIYAVKIFEKSLFQSDCDQKSLIKEIQVLRVLNNNSTIHLLELYESSNFLYLVTELLKGGSLNYYLEKHSPLSEKETSQIIYQLLSAIKYINHCGIFHRDLKPDNIMFKEKNNLDSLCITDFGLADFYNSEGQYLFNRCGSVGFVAPEVLHDQIYDYKVDLYSIGIIMYSAISGNQPFEGDSQQKVYQNYIGEVNTSNLKLSEQGHSLIKGLLQPNPILRLDVGQALKHTWFYDQNTNQLKIFAIKKRQSVQNKNLLPLPQYSPGPSPRSPLHLSGQSKQTLLQQIGPKKRVSNFYPDEEFQLTIPTERQDQKNKFLKEQARKSIFKHLEPLK